MDPTTCDQMDSTTREQMDSTTYELMVSLNELQLETPPSQQQDPSFQLLARLSELEGTVAKLVEDNASLRKENSELRACFTGSSTIQSILSRRLDDVNSHLQYIMETLLRISSDQNPMRPYIPDNPPNIIGFQP